MPQSTFNPYNFTSFQIRTGSFMPDDLTGTAGNVGRVLGVNLDGKKQAVDLSKGSTDYDTVADYLKTNPVNPLASWTTSIPTASLFGYPAGRVKVQRPQSTTTGGGDRQRVSPISDTLLTGPLGLSMLGNTSTKRLLGA